MRESTPSPEPAAGPAAEQSPASREPLAPSRNHPPRPDRPAAPCEPLWRDALGERLRSVRLERGEKLTETADRAGISPQYLSEMERGVKEPSSEMIAAVAGALELSLADLTLAVAERLRTPSATASVRAQYRSAYALAA